MIERRWSSLLLVTSSLAFAFFVPKFLNVLPDSQDRSAQWSTSTFFNKTNASHRINACIFILSRNSDLDDLTRTIRELELRFNSAFNYPYVVVNDVEFTDDFKRTIASATNATVEFGIVPPEHWSVPKWINRAKLVRKFKKEMSRLQRGTEISYHQMCRFFAGFFFRHPLTLKYDYFMRLDTKVELPCPFGEDPFETLVAKNKSYGFTISLEEEPATIPSLWHRILRWMKKRELTFANDLGELRGIAARKGGLPRTHNPDECPLDLFHFWNNFEVAEFALFRDPLYISYFEHLDRTGGFFYERWGDAPVHTFYILSMVPLTRVYRFKDIGYGHTGRFNWPQDGALAALCREAALDYEFPDCNFKWDSISQSLRLNNTNGH